MDLPRNMTRPPSASSVRNADFTSCFMVAGPPKNRIKKIKSSVDKTINIPRDVSQNVDLGLGKSRRISRISFFQ